MEELHLWLRVHHKDNIGGGSQGECYLIGDKVFKIFLQYIIDYDFEDSIDCDMEYDKDEILQFSSIKNNTYVWPLDVITVGNKVVGYTVDYVNAKSLFKIDPLRVGLDKFEKNLRKAIDDVKIISNNGVLTYDVTYNTLYGKSGLKVIDTMEYSLSDMDSVKVYRKNLKTFMYEIRMFLVDGYFDKFINDNKFLYEMCYDDGADFVEFLKEFRKKLSENEGFEILKLGDAKKSISFERNRKMLYMRDLYR